MQNVCLVQKTSQSRLDVYNIRCIYLFRGVRHHPAWVVLVLGGPNFVWNLNLQTLRSRRSHPGLSQSQPETILDGFSPVPATCHMGRTWNNHFVFGSWGFQDSSSVLVTFTCGSPPRAARPGAHGLLHAFTQLLAHGPLLVRLRHDVTGVAPLGAGRSERG